MIRDFFPPPGSPCAKCGARPDIGCPHRPADASYHPPAQDDERDGRSRPDGGQGRNFGNRRISGGGQYPGVRRGRRRSEDA